VLAWRAQGAGATEAQRLEGIRGLHVVVHFLSRRQSPGSDDLEGVFLAQELLFAEHLGKRREEAAMPRYFPLFPNSRRIRAPRTKLNGSACQHVLVRKIRPMGFRRSIFIFLVFAHD